MRFPTYILTIGILFTGVCMCFQYPCIFDLAFSNDIHAIRDTNAVEFSLRSVEFDVIFYLYTRDAEEEILTFKKDELLNSSFDNNKGTKIIIHGYFDNKNRPMPQNIKKNYLDAEDVNVIIVDWGKIAIGINYFNIAKQTPAVGKLLGEFLHFLITNGCSPKSLHLIGHSLGAHIAGYAGAFMRNEFGDEGKIARITGLDPAKPMFQDVDESQRLDETDAEFVDCIHTCGGLLGLYEPMGHADFYPNGGKNLQPGCTIFDFGRCSHIRSHEYYAESILPNHIFPAFNCTYKDCIETKERMGNPVSNMARGIYYVETNRKAPYATLIV